MLKAVTLMFILGLTSFASDDLVGVTRVIDGDTIVINKVKIRLHGIDAVESNQECINAANLSWQCGRAASNYLQRVLSDKSVSCSQKDTDRYGRVVAVCSVDGKDINGLMVEQGHAIAYRFYSKDYIEQEDRAHKLKIGIWSGKFIQPVEWRKGKRFNTQVDNSECNIKGNISSKGVKIFHVIGGHYYSQTKINTSKGERWFCSETEAVNAGWRKSKR